MPEGVYVDNVVIKKCVSASCASAVKRESGSPLGLTRMRPTTKRLVQ